MKNLYCKIAQILKFTKKRGEKKHNIRFYNLQLEHEQKRQYICVAEQNRNGSLTVAKLIVYETVLVGKSHDSKRPLCDVNALNLAIYLASVCDRRTMKAKVVMR